MHKYKNTEIQRCIRGGRALAIPPDFFSGEIHKQKQIHTRNTNKNTEHLINTYTNTEKQKYKGVYDEVEWRQSGVIRSHEPCRSRHEYVWY